MSKPWISVSVDVKYVFLWVPNHITWGNLIFLTMTVIIFSSSVWLMACHMEMKGWRMKRSFRWRKHSKPYADRKTLTVSLHMSFLKIIWKWIWLQSSEHVFYWRKVVLHLYASVWERQNVLICWYVIYKCISNHKSRDKEVSLNFSRKVNLINAQQRTELSVCKHIKRSSIVSIRKWRTVTRLKIIMEKVMGNRTRVCSQHLVHAVTP